MLRYAFDVLDCVRFSIIDEEWPLVRENLEKKLTEYRLR